MTPIPEWATRAAEALRVSDWDNTRAGQGWRTAEVLARVLGPEREALEAEVRKLKEALRGSTVGQAETVAEVERLESENAILTAEVRTLRAKVGALTEARFAASEAARVATERAEAAERERDAAVRERIDAKEALHDATHCSYCDLPLARGLCSGSCDNDE